MQTVEELVEKYGIDKVNAQKTLESYEARIGTEHGEFIVTDITYKGRKEREIELTCRKCNTKLIKVFIHDKNKWRDLIHHCPTCKGKAREESKRIEEEKIERECLERVGKRHRRLLYYKI